MSFLKFWGKKSRAKDDFDLRKEETDTEIEKRKLRHTLSISRSGRFKQKKRERGGILDRPELYGGEGGDGGESKDCQEHSACSETSSSASTTSSSSAMSGASSSTSRPPGSSSSSSSSSHTAAYPHPHQGNRRTSHSMTT